MELTRRKFGKLLTGTAISLLTGFSYTAGKALPARFVQAVRGKFFPGRIRRPDEKDMGRQAGWSG